MELAVDFYYLCIMNTFIYGLIDPRNNKIRYIGKSNNPNQRFINHCSKSQHKGTYKYNWIMKLIDLGLSPILIAIEEVPIEDWKTREKYWINYYKDNSLVNCTQGGDGLSYGNQTSFKKGHTPWNKGKSGYTTTKKGREVPQEVRDKISNTLKGKPSKKKREVIQLTLEGIFINQFTSIKEAIDTTGIKGISNVLTGRAKTAGNYKWTYKN